MANSEDHLSFDDLSVFLDICDTGGFRTTAQRMGLSPSSVSERVKRLEQSLGVPLLTRTTRSVSPTDAGRILADRLVPLYKEARAALTEAASSQNEVRGLLKLNVTGAVMVDIFPPIVDRFLEAHPGVQMEFVVEDRLVDAVAAGCDAGIRYGEHLAQDMIAVPIGPKVQRTALAAAPSYLARHGKLRLGDWVTLGDYTEWALPVEIFPARGLLGPRHEAGWFIAHNLVRPLTWLGLLENSPQNVPAMSMMDRQFRKTVLFDKFFKIGLPIGIDAVILH